MSVRLPPRLRSSGFRLTPIVLVWMLLAISEPAPAQETRDELRVRVIRAEILIADPLEPPIRDARIVVEEGRIVTAGSVGTVEVPSGAREIDLSGYMVLPGLIDSHIHPAAGGAIGLRTNPRRAWWRSGPPAPCTTPWRRA